MSDDVPLKSGGVSSGRGGARPGSGAKPLHVRMTSEELDAACMLLRSGRATLYAAICSQFATCDSVIDRSRQIGKEALLRREQGEDLSESDSKAADFYEKTQKAIAAREIILNRQALGDTTQIGEDADGNPIYANNDPRFAGNAVKILALTSQRWMPKSEQKVEHSGTVTTTTDLETVRRERQALEARLAAAEANDGASE